MEIVDVLLPQYGMGMQDGEIVIWRKRVGDGVREGDILAEIEAAKTTAELPAPCDGVLIEIVVAQGQTAQVRTVLARIRRAGEEGKEGK